MRRNKDKFTIWDMLTILLIFCLGIYVIPLMADAIVETEPVKSVIEMEGRR